MSLRNSFYNYLSDNISFTSEKASQIRSIYFPLCGTTSDKIKSSITPYLSGDIKIDKNRYITKPASVEDLKQPVRNFFVYVEGKGVISLANRCQDDVSFIEIGQMWQKMVVSYKKMGLELEALSFIPVSGDNIELMKIVVRNTSKKTIKIIPTAAIPVFGRALANKHDHEHVTSLLNRIEQIDSGIIVSPSMSFNEEGHKTCSDVYYVLGQEGDGKNPAGTFPTVENFCCDSGTLAMPRAVIDNLVPKKISSKELNGKEAMGAIRFKAQSLAPSKEKEYLIAIGVASNKDNPAEIFEEYNSTAKFGKALQCNKKFWHEKSNSIVFNKGDKDFNSWIHWVELQPVLRRIFGCSFLPDHDYGKGGKGWRDIWQDLLSLILIEPDQVRDALVNNFAGVRIDGSNATIIGTKPGEFTADRNAITRVWMDHGVWPLVTLLLYINQTGDFDILLEETTYFRDTQLSRTFQKDSSWTNQYGNKLKFQNGKEYKGSILEHMLVQNLVQFFNVGKHNIIRLESADWNDGLDMAFDKGESVAFMSMYGGNLNDLAELIEGLAVKEGIDKITVAKELMILLDSISGEEVDYNNIEQKKRLLFDAYFASVQPEISGEKIEIGIRDIVSDLRAKAKWVFDHINLNEKISIKENGRTFKWFNGYYDNKEKRVEGKIDGNVRMTLTGQVFPIMSGLADDKYIGSVIESVREYLKDKVLGGFRLNTDFGINSYLDLGRAFGFAYGTKENGAFFSHMVVMYAYALYKRGFAKEGYEVLDSIYKMCIDAQRSKIFPGVPEYFDSNGLGRYHFLTGSASWFILTELTQVFGVRGNQGDLMLDPKLTKKEFGKNKTVSVSCQFAQKNISVKYLNEKLLDYGSYKICDVLAENKPIEFKRNTDSDVIIKRTSIEKMPLNVKIIVVLG